MFFFLHQRFFVLKLACINQRVCLKVFLSFFMVTEQAVFSGGSYWVGSEFIVNF